MVQDSLLFEPLLAAHRQLRIALVTETYPPDINGVALTLCRIVDGLRAKGHDLWLVRPGPSRRTSEHDASKLSVGPADLVVRGMPIPMYPELTLGLPAKRALVKLWTHRRPDVVHVATEGPLGWSAIQAAKKLRLPITSDFRTNFHAYSSFYGLSWLKTAIVGYMRKFHNSASCTMVPTDELKEALNELGFQRLVVIPRGIDTDLFCPQRRSTLLRKQWGASDSTIVLLSVGRLAAEKNLSLVVSTYEYLTQHGYDARLVFVGDGPLRGRLLERCPSAIFCGLKRDVALAEHFASGDIFLFPSVTETFGNVTLEAMASGLPVVAYRRAAARQLIDHLQNGVLAQEENQSSYLQEVLKVVKDQALRGRLGIAARQASLNKGWPAVIDRTEDTIRKAAIDHRFISDAKSLLCSQPF